MRSGSTTTYGRRVTPLINELGYPDRHTLYNWVKDYKASGAIPKGGYSKSSYTEERKRAAVEHYLSYGRWQAFTRRELGYPLKELLS